MFLIIAISHKRDFCNRHLESCNMLFGTWSQAHAYDPSDYMETMQALMLMYSRKTHTKVLVTYSFSLYLIVSPTELSESAQFLKRNCAYRCMELVRITLVVVVRKHPGSVASLRGEFKIS